MSWEKPLYLDLYSCEGGAAMGAHLAGCHVVCVDIAPQPRNPFEFYQADALDFLREHGHEFDIIGASPPCEFGCQMFNPVKGRDPKHVNMIPDTRKLLQEIGKPYLIENVALNRKHLVNPIKLTGSMFSETSQLFRDRYYEVFPRLPFDYADWVNPVRYDYTPIPVNSSSKKGNTHAPIDVVRKAMGMEWASREGLRQGIPPAYNRFVVEWLLQFVGWGKGELENHKVINQLSLEDF